MGIYLLQTSNYPGLHRFGKIPSGDFLDLFFTFCFSHLKCDEPNIHLSYFEGQQIAKKGIDKHFFCSSVKKMYIFYLTSSISLLI